MLYNFPYNYAFEAYNNPEILGTVSKEALNIPIEKKELSFALTPFYLEYVTLCSRFSRKELSGGLFNVTCHRKGWENHNTVSLNKHYSQ